MGGEARGDPDDVRVDPLRRMAGERRADQAGQRDQHEAREGRERRPVAGEAAAGETGQRRAHADGLRRGSRAAAITSAIRLKTITITATSTTVPITRV